MRRQLGSPLDKDTTNNAIVDYALRHSKGRMGLRRRLTIAPRFPKSKLTSKASVPELLRHAIMLIRKLSRKKMIKDMLFDTRKKLSQLSEEELIEWIDKADKEIRGKAIEKAAKAQWQKRMTFLKHFFKMKRDKVTIDGKRCDVWIPEKELH